MFLSSYENKLDKKGRVSVPANFRSHLSSLGYNGFIAYPSFNHEALEACSDQILFVVGRGLEPPFQPLPNILNHLEMPYDT